jgi:hypothetical protein
MKKLWKDRRGSGIIPAFGVALIFLLFSCACMEYFRLQSTAAYVRDAVQSAVVETCTEQYADLYAGVREGYSGGYKCSEGEWKENLSAADIYGRLNTSLGTETDGDGVVKYAGSDENFRLSGLNAQITNAPFAPDGENTEQLTCTAEIDLEVPLMFHWNGVPPLRTHLIIKGGYMPKF